MVPGTGLGALKEPLDRSGHGTRCAGMIEIVIERWSGPTGTDNFHWSVWRDGRRLGMDGPFPTAEASEEDAKRFCRETLGRDADRLTRL